MAAVDSSSAAYAWNSAVAEVYHSSNPALVVLFTAADHKWGEGKSHICDQAEPVTRCGIDVLQAPGTITVGHQRSHTCRTCSRSLAAEQERERRQAEWAREQRQRQLEQEAKNKEWWDSYNAYLQTPQWRRKRELVMRRAGNTCEGCLQNPAKQVHHLTYQRVKREMLFDLVALCERCHQELHRGS